MEKTLNIGEKAYLLTSDDDYLDAMGDDFEPHMVQLFNALIKPNDVVVDVGANIGLTAILFSGLAKKVYAFEPAPSTFEILKTNLSRAQAGNVEAINLGLGESTEKLSITFIENNRSGGFVSKQIKPVAGHVTEEIQIESLDNFFSRNVDPLNFIKIDVEGFEQNVIKGALDLIKKHKPLVTLELNHYCLNALQRITVPDFFDFLRSVFPFLYAVDTDNTTIADLHDADQSYFVMHEHLVHFRFPNLVGGFDPALTATLKKLESTAKTELAHCKPLIATPEVTNATGSVQVLTPPKAVHCNERFSLDIEVSNNSTCVWRGSGDRPVCLSYHWQDKAGNTLIFDGDRSVLKNGAIQPGQTVQATMKVIAPPDPGDLRLMVTLVQEQVCWFENRGFTPDEITVDVNECLSNA
jgi:FkbM family methyltransferase